MKWQPIETAPKDGTYVLVYLCGWFPDTNHADIACWIDGAWETLDRLPNMNPTHWMPLPAPPEAL